MFKRINVKARLAESYYIEDTSCPLCSEVQEIVDNLFLKCKLSQKCCAITEHVLVLQAAGRLA